VCVGLCVGLSIRHLPPMHAWVVGRQINGPPLTPQPEAGAGRDVGTTLAAMVPRKARVALRTEHWRLVPPLPQPETTLPQTDATMWTPLPLPLPTHGALLLLLLAGCCCAGGCCLAAALATDDAPRTRAAGE